MPRSPRINGTNNQNLYINNTTDAYNTEMDGFTVTMTLKMTVIPGQVNTIRIGIADVSDAQYDSNVLIAGNSVQTALIAHDDAVTLAPGQTKTIDVLANDTGPGGSTLTITHINGQCGQRRARSSRWRPASRSRSTPMAR